MLNIGWDTETYLIAAPHDLIPRIVCGSWDAAAPGQVASDFSAVLSTGEPHDLLNQCLEMWQGCYSKDHRIVIQNAEFDITVLMRYCQDITNNLRFGDRSKAAELYQLMWETLEVSMDSEWEGGPILVSDTLIREQLLNLSGHGSITVDAKGREVRYGLADLAYRYLRIDRRSSKVKLGEGGKILNAQGKDITGTTQANDSWRLRYSELDGVPVKDWPKEAYEYALDDAILARQVWDCQEAKINHSPRALHNTARSESLQVYSAVALRLCGTTGFRVDRQQVLKVEEELAKSLGQIEPTLRACGILRSNNSVNKALVADIIKEVCATNNLEVSTTETEQVAMGKEIMQILAPFDPRLKAFAERQLLAKLRDAFLPALQEEKVWTQFDTLKETGRTSSRGSSSRGGKRPLYSAVNCQQIPRRAGIRECFLPTEPGYILCSVDYGALELCSVAQTTYSLFKRSVHRDKINAGYDLHSFLGSAAAALKESELVDHIPLSLENMDQIYAAFIQKLKYRPPREYQGGDSEIEHRIHLAKRAKHYRTYAKPTGLGYPGGLGPDTMVVYSRTTYGVEMTKTEAAQMKELWFVIYPEMVDYFAAIRNWKDLRNRDEEDDSPKYCYSTPGFDRFRAGCFYCAAANGAAMQSLSADGAKRSVCWTARALSGGLVGDNPFRILDKAYHQAFIHDENILAFPDDPAITERAFASSQLMVQAMQIHMPDVRISAEPALMTRWSKAAEPEWIEDLQGKEKAWYQLASEFGPDLATKMLDMFSTNDGRRLVPFDRRGP